MCSAYVWYVSSGVFVIRKNAADVS